MTLLCLGFYYYIPQSLSGSVAQSVEQQPFKLMVPGSIPG